MKCTKYKIMIDYESVNKIYYIKKSNLNYFNIL